MPFTCLIEHRYYDITCLISTDLNARGCSSSPSSLHVVNLSLPLTRLVSKPLLKALYWHHDFKEWRLHSLCTDYALSSFVYMHTGIILHQL